MSLWRDPIHKVLLIFACVACVRIWFTFCNILAIFIVRLAHLDQVTLWLLDTVCHFVKPVQAESVQVELENFAPEIDAVPLLVHFFFDLERLNLRNDRKTVWRDPNTLVGEQTHRDLATVQKSVGFEK